MVVVADVDDADDEILERMFDDASITGGRFPFVYALLQPRDPVAVDLDALMQGRGFTRVA